MRELTASQITALRALPFVSCILCHFDDYGPEHDAFMANIVPEGTVFAIMSYPSRDDSRFDDLKYYEYVAHAHYCTQAQYDAINPPGKLDTLPLTYTLGDKLRAA